MPTREELSKLPMPVRNFMVEVENHKRVEPNEFYPDGDYCFSSGWLHQKHPFGYDIDYFTTRDDALAAIERYKQQVSQETGYWLAFTIYELKDVTGNDGGLPATELYQPEFENPDYCCHVECGAYTNWIYCSLSENNSRTGYERCDHLRKTGRCLHP